ncbi:MAG: extracellular solute-binding protein [Ruminococcaceae bacterium]|nr:extracellular solute-binding protein [Oscillospiraceae bacterium]
MKKLGIFLLIAVMLTQLAACGSGNTEETEAATEAATENTETTRIQHQIPDELDFGGATMGVANLKHDLSYYFADESSSDNMVASVYRRTVKTEDFLGINIDSSTEVDYSNFITLYKSGDDLYQLLFVGDITDTKNLVTEGYLYNMDTLPYVDFSAEWWNAEQMDILRLSKNTYYGISDFILTNPCALLFNRNLITDNNLDSPYQLVLDGKWTLDKFIELGKAVINDANGNGEFYDEDDINAITVADYSQAIAFVPACDQPISAKNEEGRLEMTLKTEKMLQIADKLLSVCETTGFLHCSVTTGNGVGKSFSTGNVLYVREGPASMASAADYDFDTGIVPMPKFDEAQEKYMCDTSSVKLAVSGQTKNAEMVGAALEFLAWDSKNEVFPTYYDVLLKTRYSQDMETREMMNIIFDSISYEIGGVYFGMSPGFCELWYTGAQHMVFGEKNFNALFRAFKGPANNTINEFYTAVEKIEGSLFVEETTADTAAQ